MQRPNFSGIGWKTLSYSGCCLPTRVCRTPNHANLHGSYKLQSETHCILHSFASRHTPWSQSTALRWTRHHKTKQPRASWPSGYVSSMGTDGYRTWVSSRFTFFLQSEIRNLGIPGWGKTSPNRSAAPRRDKLLGRHESGTGLLQQSMHQSPDSAKAGSHWFMKVPKGSHHGSQRPVMIG